MANPLHSVTDEFQFDELLPRLDVKVRTVDISANIFTDFLSVLLYDQLDFDKYNNLTSRAVHNTFAYMFHKFKKGIFMSINDGKLASCIPFDNREYINEWSHLLRVDPTKYPNIQALIDKTSKVLGFTPKQIHKPLQEWYANDAMFRFDEHLELNETNVAVFNDMLSTLCAERDVPDIEFFINKRDYPLLKVDETEPYENLFGSKFQKLLSYLYEQHSPILSGSIASGFADVLMPTYEDWARAKYQRDSATLPTSFKSYPVIENKIPWMSKKDIAVFRGSSTGAGVTPNTNQRLRALELSEKFPNHLDVGITKWNTRIRKHISSKFLDTIERSSYPKAAPLSLQEQTDKYKYILTLEGHVAAYRLSYELSSNSLILLAGSRWKLWFSQFLKPFVHYVPIKENLSDLIEKIEWCRNNDTECQRIVANANKFYEKYLGVDGILDFLQKTFVELSRTIGGYTWLPNLVDLSLREEINLMSSNNTSDTPYKHPIAGGPRCAGKLVATDKALSKVDNLEFVRNIFTGKNCKIDCMKTNGFFVTRKTVTTESKRKRQLHEVYIGRHAVNNILRECPNFAYIYEPKHNETFSEFINGPLLAQWIASDKYNEHDLVNILCAVNLALSVAQTRHAFVHYNLTPWNVIVQTTSVPVAFDYNIDAMFPLRYTSNIVPVIISYGKSRAVVYEPKYGLVDRGYLNSYRTRTRAVDTLSLVYSTMNIIAKEKRQIPRILFDFLKSVSLPLRLKGIVEFVNTHEDKVADITPMTFVNFIANSGMVQLNVVSPGDFKQKMNKGNAFVEEMIMKYGDVKTAVKEAVTRLYRQTIPTSDNAVISAVTKTFMASHLRDLDEYVATANDKLVTERYEQIKRNLAQPQTFSSNLMTMDFPDVPYLRMDTYLTPEELEEFAKDAVKTDGDWVTINSTCLLVSTLDPKLDIFGVLGNPMFVSFNYLNEIASENTLLWISKAV